MEARLVANRDQFGRDLDAARADADKWAAKPVTVTLRADGDQARAALDDLAARKAKAGADVSFRVGATGTAEVQADLDKVEAKKAAVGRPVTIPVKVKADSSGLDSIGKKITALTDGPFSLLTTAIVGLAPAAVPVLGAVTAAILPVAAAAGSAATGLGAFGLIAKSVLTQAATASAAAQAAQSAYNTAVGKAAYSYQAASAAAKTHDQQVAALTAYRKADAAAAIAQSTAVDAAYGNMSQAQINLSRQVGLTTGAWKATLHSVTPLVASALVPWMADVRNLLQYIKPLVTPVAALFAQWGTQLGQSLTGNTAKIRSFTDAFAGRSADNIRNFGNALKFFVEAAAALIRDAAPAMAGGSLAVARLAASFDGWARSKAAADDITGFFTWAKAEIPTVKTLISEIAVTIGNLVKAMAYTGSGDLTVLTAVLGAISKLPPAAIAGLADAYIALSIGLRLASAALAVNTALTGGAVIAQKALGLSAKEAAASVEEMSLAEKLSAVGSYAAGLVATAAKAVAAFAVMAASAVASAATQAAAWVAAAAVTVASFLADAAAATVAFIAENLATLGIAAAIALLVAAIVYLATHWSQAWGEITRIAEAAWHFIYDGFGKYLLPLLGPVGLLALGAIEVAKHWAAITAAFAGVIDWLAGHWKIILVILTGPLGLAILWIIHSWAGLKAATEAAWNAIGSFLSGWWARVAGAVTAGTARVSSAVSSAWSRVASGTAAAWNATGSFLSSWWARTTSVAASRAEATWRAVSVAWAHAASATQSVWGGIARYFTAWWNGEVAAFRSDAAAIAGGLLAAWHGIDSAARSVFGGLRSFFTTFWGFLRTGFTDAVAGVRAAWGGITSAVKIPVEWVVQHVYDDLIVRFWNDVAGPVGLPKLSAFAAGGVVPGGYSRTDDQLAWVRSGEGILQPGAVAALGGEGFVTWANARFGDVPVSGGGGGGYAGGGVIPNPLPAIGHAVAGAVSGAYHGVAGLLGGLVNDVRNGVYGAMAGAGGAVISDAAKAVPGATGVAEAMRAYPLRLWDGFASWVAGHGPGPATPAGGVSLAGLSGSSGYAAFKAVAAKLGWGPALLADWVAVEMMEAGFRLTARNPGSGAYGMAQFINGPGEYAQYGGNAGTYIGQAVAMANYIAGRYGNPAAALAHERAYHWYDDGGWLQPGASMVMNATGRPEPVLTGDQWDALTAAASGGGRKIADVLNLTLPEGSTVTAALNELDYRLRAARMQGFLGGA